VVRGIDEMGRVRDSGGKKKMTELSGFHCPHCLVTKGISRTFVVRGPSQADQLAGHPYRTPYILRFAFSLSLSLSLTQGLRLVR
jgi:hypothetical protein